MQIPASTVGGIAQKRIYTRVKVRNSPGARKNLHSVVKGMTRSTPKVFDPDSDLTVKLLVVKVHHRR